MFGYEQKNRFKRMFSVALIGTSLFLAACPRIDIKDGQIPNEYMAEAQKLAGIYAGEFDRKEGVFEITFVGNKPIVKFLDRHNFTMTKDLLFEGCGSTINQLNSIVVDKVRSSSSGGSDQYLLSEADFVFNPGQCGAEVRGREVYLNFSKDYEKIGVELLERYDERCRLDPPTTPGGGSNRTCESYPVYRKGRFVRVKE